MTNIEKLESLIAEIEKLIDHNVTTIFPAFIAWKTSTERFLITHFGKDSFEHQKFLETKFLPSVYASNDTLIEWCRRGLVTTRLLLIEYLTEMQEAYIAPVNNPASRSFDRVFIVHGHDGELKQSVARVIEKQGIEAVILSEQANRGLTIIEKFEENADVGGAICLFTSDDLGRVKSATDDQPRARQNVVFEAGYFMGKLGRGRIVFLADSGVEMPSDLSGVVYTSTVNWQVELLKELKAMGYIVDFNKLY